MPHSETSAVTDRSVLETEKNSIKSHPEPASPEDGEGGQPSSAESADISAIADNIISEMPEVQEHAIHTENMQQQQKMAEWADLRDTDGNSFDPKIHKTNKAGEPTLSTKGKLIKKPGRKAKPESERPQSVIGPSAGTHTPAAPTESEVAKQMARASGTVAANMVMQIGIVAGGEEWQPMKDEETGLDEKALMESAWADYFEATGKQDIPPGMALTVVMLGYILPRFTMPKTQTRLQKLKTWISEKWANRKLKKHGLKAVPTNGSRDDTRANAQR